MLPVDNATAAPEGQVVVAPTGKPLDTQVSTDSPNLPADKYAGKTLEEVIEMHKNAEKAFTEKAMEIAELKKAPKEEVTPVQIDELAKLFAPQLAADAPQEVIENVQLKQTNINNTLKIAFMEARSDSTMPEFKDVEADIKTLLVKKPWLLLGSPEQGIRDAYDLVSKERLEKNTATLIAEAEERGKNTVKNVEAAKVNAAIISDSGRTAPIEQNPIVETPDEKRVKLMAQLKSLGERDPRRKQVMRELTMVTLTPSELKGTPTLNDLVK